MITNLVRLELQKIKPYTPSSTLEDVSADVGIAMEKIVKLDTGENPYVEKFQQKNMLKRVNLYSYPDPFCTKLRQKLASYTSFGSQWIICSNGSDELIDLLIRLFVSPGQEIIINPPTFPMYEFYAALSASKIKQVLRNDDLAINIDKVIKSISAITKLIFIDSPGNPSGTVVSDQQVRQLLNKEVIVVVDEAYFEYCQQTVLPLVKRYPNLIVLRTFSKWAGLAGLRIGYLVANPKIINLLQAIKSPYNVNVLAQLMAVTVLEQKDKFLQEVKKVVNLRDKYIQKVSQLPKLKVYPSVGAYIIFQPKIPAIKIYQFLRENGVLVKLISQPRLDNCIRVNIGKEKELGRLIFLLRRFY